MNDAVYLEAGVATKTLTNAGVSCDPSIKEDQPDT